MCVAVGMTVEFTAHIVHRFLEEQGDTRKERVVAAMKFMGPAMVHGLITSIISVCFLAASQTPVIRDYYFQMYVNMMLIAGANGLILLPVVLSVVGPAPIQLSAGRTVLGQRSTADGVFNPVFTKP